MDTLSVECGCEREHVEFLVRDSFGEDTEEVVVSASCGECGSTYSLRVCVVRDEYSALLARERLEEYEGEFS